MKTIDPERWKALSPYLDEALEIATGQRDPWLTALAQREPAIAADLRILLAEYQDLDRAGFLAGTAAQTPRTSSLAGQVVGAYTLVSSIGAGGMGSVWLARRSDGRFEGSAAVKLLDASLIGRGGEERFIREGTILARLTHPSIAHLIDAGVTPTGQPYLVLEYVEGEHIDAYCDNRQLDVPARVRLFLSVLTAVAHAHAHLVVHRDIKPSNVLIRTHDAERSAASHGVKLLDFGIAKLVGPESENDRGVAIPTTRDSGWALTPQYAAPEQLTGGAVTTATDVYSLGVLLYALLSGQHPAASGLGSPAALIEVIVEREAPRLSDSIAHAATDDTVATGGEGLQTPHDPRRLAPCADGRPRHDRREGAQEESAGALPVGDRLRGRPPEIPQRSPDRRAARRIRVPRGQVRAPAQGAGGARLGCRACARCRS